MRHAKTVAALRPFHLVTRFGRSSLCNGPTVRATGPVRNLQCYVPYPLFWSSKLHDRLCGLPENAQPATTATSSRPSLSSSRSTLHIFYSTKRIAHYVTR